MHNILQPKHIDEWILLFPTCVFDVMWLFSQFQPLHATDTKKQLCEATENRVPLATALQKQGEG